ncbi:MAG: CAP domain-containing protein [Chloroflexota bacterium]
MLKQIKYYFLAAVVFLALISNLRVQAQPIYESSPFDLINAVNALRAAYGLPAYSINSTLMFTAQNQADFMAATGNVTHFGPGGINVTARLLAAGYPLAGDLSVGGFRSENIIEGNGMSAQEAVDAWMGDAPHQFTMLSQDLTEIGAGVAVVNNAVYYVIDCARSTTSGVPQASTPISVGGATVPAGEAVVYPVVLSTPNANGEVIHEVQPGQTLWQIAISYQIKIDDIKRLNYIVENNIYPGDKLLIKKEAAPSAMPPTETAIPELTVTVAPSATIAPTLTATQTRIPVAPIARDNKMLIPSVIAILVLAMLGGSFFTWLGNSSKDKPS